jgi:CBS domain containing-hemolysin-like protein
VSDPLVLTLATIALIALSAFFVIIEFALLGARRHRLEELAVTSRSARAALRGMNDLTLMLAGAQLGITACTFALGAVTKPAVDAWLGPALVLWGLPEWASGGTSFALSLFVVTFLHLVIGEMAPKSWAIAHPETSALAIGVISRAYVWPLRPLLRWINGIANRLVRASGVEPVESAAVGGRDAATIRQLVEHSARVGSLAPQLQRQISASSTSGPSGLKRWSPLHPQR